MIDLNLFIRKENDDLKSELGFTHYIKLAKNESRHCGSGKKYKKCCLDGDIKVYGGAIKVQVGAKMNLEKCKSCHKEYSSGIWLSPQFKNEKVLLFCSAECQDKYLEMELERIKVNYPAYYEKLTKSKK